MAKNALMTQQIDPRYSRFFRPQEVGQDMATQGNGDGSGFMGSLSTLPGAEAYMTPYTGTGDAMSGGGIDADALYRYLQERGYTLNESQTGPQIAERYLTDASGADVGTREQVDYGDENFWTAAQLATALVGGATASWANAGNGIGGAAAATEGTAPYVMSSADKAALFGAEGYGAGMTGAETAAYATGAGTTAGNTMSSKAGTSLADFFSGNGSMNDYLRAGQGLYGLYSQNKATDAAQQGNQQQMDLMQRMYDQNRADNQPLLDLRNSVLPQINSLLKDPSSITQQPGYQFQLKQGQNQLNNRAAASGNYYSGAQMKAAQQYGQDYAGTKLDQSLNRLMGVATGTQVGGQNNQANNNQFAVSGGNALQQGGNIRAGGYLGQYNTVNNGVNNWMQDQYDRKYWGGGG